MIVPIANEQQWQPLFDAAAPWTPPHTDTVCIVPHPDDEALGVGGLISALASSGASLRVIAVTDGENAYAEECDLASVRIPEQEQSLESLGVNNSKTVRLGLPDSGVSAHEAELIAALKPLVTSETHLIAPWPGDFHPDHEACGRAAQEVAKLTGASLTFYFFWTWHRGEPSLLQDVPLLRFELTAAQQQAKQHAISRHQSQLTHASGEPILPDNLLWPARQPFEIFLSQ